MEYAKDEVFSIQYNDTKNTLEIGKSGTSRIVKFLKKNRLIKIITLLAILFSAVNIIFIYNFFTLLNTL